MQVTLIKSKLREALGDRAQEIDVHSIDGFQVPIDYNCYFLALCACGLATCLCSALNQF